MTLRTREVELMNGRVVIEVCNDCESWSKAEMQKVISLCKELNSIDTMVKLPKELNGSFSDNALFCIVNLSNSFVSCYQTLFECCNYCDITLEVHTMRGKIFDIPTQIQCVILENGIVSEGIAYKDEVICADGNVYKLSEVCLTNIYLGWVDLSDIIREGVSLSKEDLC